MAFLIKDQSKKGSIHMKISIDMLDKSGLVYDWKTLYVGISANLIECSELSVYALKMLECKETMSNDFLVELACNCDDYAKEELLTHMILKLNLEFPNNGDDIWDIELRKLRFSILNYLNNSIQDNMKLLKIIEEVYSDFSYPEDMEDFIYYMPSKINTEIISIEENIRRMIESFNSFMNIEKNKLLYC